MCCFYRKAIAFVGSGMEVNIIEDVLISIRKFTVEIVLIEGGNIESYLKW